MRDLPGQQHLHSVGLASDRSRLRCSSSPERGPGRDGMPSVARPFDPSLEAGVTDKTAGKHAPFVLQVTREDGDQNLTELNVRPPPGFTASLRGVPYCPEAAIAHLGDSSYSGLAEQSHSRLSRRESDRHGRQPAPAPAPGPCTSGERCIWPGPIKALRSASWQSSRRFRALRSRQRRCEHGRLSSIRRRPRSMPFQILSRRSSGAFHCAPDSVQLELDRNDFALNPTNCDPFSVGSDHPWRPGGPGQSIAALPGGRLQPPGLRPEAQAQSFGRRQATRASGHPCGPHHQSW